MSKMNNCVATLPIFMNIFFIIMLILLRAR
jgi:hypothetical protein